MWAVGMTKYIILSILLSLHLTSGALAEMKIVEKTTYYQVSGNTGQEIVDYMFNQKYDLVNEDGLILHGKTKISIKIDNIEVGIKNNRCRLLEYDTTATFNYTLPKWQASNKATAETRAAWNNYLQAILKRQKKLKKVAISFIRKSERKFKSLGNYRLKSCTKSAFVRHSKYRHSKREYLYLPSLTRFRLTTS